MPKRFSIVLLSLLVACAEPGPAARQDTAPTAQVAQPETPPAAPAVPQRAPEELAKLIADPDAAQAPGGKVNSEEIGELPSEVWEWPDVRLTRLPGVPDAWRLEAYEYAADDLAQQRRKVASVKDETLGTGISLYSLEAGPFQGAYLLEESYLDGTGSVRLESPAFAQALGKGYAQSGMTEPLGQALSRYLAGKDAFCQSAGVTCE
ncbi:hypothetical protein ACFP81_03780 [Deinococcus lacus]|uniref:Lipoprotein n=1 Tax=Deinococcus lacus TaxID=392561 RepID=A0ABW1YAN8_9DEIO